MLKYKGYFNKEAMIQAAMGYITAYAHLAKRDECEVPFESEDGTQKGFVQFALLGGVWVYVRVRKG